MSEGRAQTNRANARASTGPRTREGKASVARNARKHGLSLPVLHDPALSREVESLARAIAQADPPRYELACRVAEAQIDILRVRRARHDILSGAVVDPDAVKTFAAMDRYERRALSRRKFAIREFDAAAGAACTSNLSPRAGRGRHRASAKMSGEGAPPRV